MGEALGSVNHVHDFTGNNHTHDFGLGGPEILDAPGGFDNISGANMPTGTTDSESSLTPFHALLPIMEL